MLLLVATNEPFPLNLLVVAVGKAFLCAAHLTDKKKLVNFGTIRADCC